MHQPLVLVSGAPGSGKSTLAHPLAAALGFTLLSKDTIKESLHTSLGLNSDLEASRRIGAAAMELLWDLAPTCPKVVLEANFRPHNSYERDKIISLDRPMVEINCQCPAAVVQKRFADRAQSGHHHQAHALRKLSDTLLAEYDRPVGLGQLIIVDTTKPADIPDLAKQILDLLLRAPHSSQDSPEAVR